jgi:hypothetical protein
VGPGPLPLMFTRSFRQMINDVPFKDQSIPGVCSYTWNLLYSICKKIRQPFACNSVRITIYFTSK